MHGDGGWGVWQRQSWWGKTSARMGVVESVPREVVRDWARLGFDSTKNGSCYGSSEGAASKVEPIDALLTRLEYI